MEDKSIQTAKLILDNETYEFNIEDGKTLHLELKNTENEIQIKRKQFNNNFSSGFERVQFNQNKPTEVFNDINDELEHESSILNVLNGVNALDDNLTTLKNVDTENIQSDTEDEIENKESSKEDPKHNSVEQIESEERVTVPDIEKTSEQNGNDNTKNISSNNFNIDFFGSDVDDFEDDNDDLKF